jgi:hypothetical protein
MTFQKEMTSLIWGRRIVRYTFELFLSLCNERNNTGHQHSSHKDSALTRQRLIYQIIAIQESNPDTPYHAHYNERNNIGHQHSSHKDSASTRQRIIYQIIAIQESNPDTPYHARLSCTLLLTVTVSVDRKLPYNK